MIEIEHGRTVNQLCKCLKQPLGFSFVSEIPNLFILRASEEAQITFFCLDGKGWSYNSLGRPEAMVGLPGHGLLLAKIRVT